GGRRLSACTEAQGRSGSGLLGRRPATVALCGAQVRRRRARRRRGGETMNTPITPAADGRPDEHFPARWWHALPDGRIQCDLCPRDCRLHEGQRGLCFVRKREGDAMVLTTWGRSSGFAI